MARLAKLVNAGNDFENKTIKLAGNIDLSKHYWTPIGDNTGNRFKGTFDGCNYMISGLVVSIEGDGSKNNLGYLAVGLFGWNDGTIKNVTISNNSSICAIATETSQYKNSRAYAGGIAGLNTGSILNCNNFGEVKAESSSYAYAGGIAGENEYEVISCHNKGKISSSISKWHSNEDNYQGSYVGGIVGYNWWAEISDCKNFGSVYCEILPNLIITSSIYVGGITGLSDNGDIFDCYNYGVISASLSLSNGSGEGSFACAGGIAGYNNSDVSNCYNSGKISSQFVTNIDMNTDSRSYLCTGGIAGSVTESSHISQCCNDGEISASYVSDTTNSAYIQNSYSCAAGIVGYPGGIINDCCNLKNAKIIAISSVTGNILDYSHAYAGGIAAYNEFQPVEILNCYNEGSISSSSTSNSSRNHSSSGSYAYGGGIIAYLSPDGLIENCYSKIGTITAESISNSPGAKDHRYFSNSYAGGISGRTLGKIINCFNESDIFSSNLVDVTTTDVDAGFRIYPSANAGGITGALDDGDENEALKAETILYCYNKGNVNASGNSNSESRSGGITGFMSGGTISYSYNCGEISAAQNGDNAYVGGIVGICVVFIQQNGPQRDVPGISQCYNKGSIQLTVNTSSNNDISGLGGICGVNNGLIKNSYNTANISCTSSAERLNVGGIVGYNHNSIDSCYNVGDLECPDTFNNCCLGSVVGKNDSTNVSNAFYINNTDGINDVGQSSASLGTDAVNGLDTDKMINLCLLSGNTNLNKNPSEMPWSPDIFGVNDGYPVLADVPIQIIPEDAQTNPEKAPKSVVYIVTNNEESQQENYLKLITLATGSKLNTSQQNSILDIFNATNPSYSWKKLIVDYDAITDKAWNDHAVTDTSKNSLTLSTNGTYCGIITYSVSEKLPTDVNAQPVSYHYTTLSRTVELKDGLVYESNDGSDRTYSVLPDETGKVTVEDNMFHYDGHAFVGWKDSANESGQPCNIGDELTITSGGKILYAQWKEASTVTIDVSQENATIVITDEDGKVIKPEKDGKYLLPPGKYSCKVSKSGYVTSTKEFTVGNLSDEENKELTVSVNLSSSSSGGGIPVSYNVTYNANGGSGTLIDTNSPYHSGVTVLVLENNFTRDGYTFKNWNTKADGSGTSYSAGERFSINSNVTLYAQWEEVSTPPVIQKVTVTFYIGNEVYKVIEVNKDSSLKDKFPVNPESDNGTFKEWNTKEDSSGKAFTADSIVNEDTSVYAVWEKSSSSSSHSWWWIMIIIIILIIIIAAYYYYKKNQN